MRKLGIALPAVLALSALLGISASADIPVGAATHAIVINHTTGLAYVGAACSCGGSIVVIDTATDAVVTTITTASTPTQIAVDEERNQIFAAHFDTGTVSVVDGGTNLVSETLPFGGLGLAVNPARDLLYATLGTGGMAVYDLTTLAHDRTVPVAPLSANWWGVAVNPVTDRIYVENLFGAVEVLDGETYALLADISIFGEARFGVTVDVGANLVYVPRYVANGRVHVIDGATNTLRSDFAAAGSFPRALALDVAAERLYSADFGSGTVTVFSTAGTLTRLETISVGGQPNGIALPTRGPKRLYVTNALSSAMTVIPITANRPPAMVSATIAPASPDTDDVLTATVVAQDQDGDPLTYSYQWTKNGADITGATDATLDLAVSGNGDRDEEIAVRVTASDGSATSAPLTSAAVTVVNTPPAMISATIAPDSPDTDDVLTVTGVAQDLDGDPLTYSYQWTKNGEDIAGATGDDTLDLGASGNGDHGDEIAVRVTAIDGSATSAPLTSAAVTVLNTPPTVTSATIAPTSPDTDDVLTATVVAQDLDGDPLTYSYQWTKQGADIPGATGATLDLAASGNGDRGDAIAVRVTATDGSSTSEPITSASLTVANSVPSASVTLDTIKPSHKGLLTASVTVADADRDTITLTYVWRVQGEVRRSITTTATSDQFDLSIPRNGSPHDTITLTVTPNDGLTDGAAVTATATVIPGN
jgi:YVTN family beta-propeller protein